MDPRNSTRIYAKRRTLRFRKEALSSRRADHSENAFFFRYWHALSVWKNKTWRRKQRSLRPRAISAPFAAPKGRRRAVAEVATEASPVRNILNEQGGDCWRCLVTALARAALDSPHHLSERSLLHSSDQSTREGFCATWWKVHPEFSEGPRSRSSIPHQRSDFSKNPIASR